MVTFLPAKSSTCRDPGTGPWRQYQNPVQAGWNASALDAARKQADDLGCGAVDRLFRCHSVRKSLLSGMLGIYVGSGDIDLQKTIGELGIDDLNPLTDTEKTARVADLLRARSGIYHPAAKEPASMERNRPPRGSRSPGEAFWHNNWDFNTLGIIFERETGLKIFPTFKRDVAAPLGMEDYRLDRQEYQYSRSKSMHPAYAFRMSARDLARFGQMILQGGRWNGEEIIPADWVKESTQVHSQVRPGVGYGYMWWIYPAGGLDAETYPVLNRYDKVAALGTGGQIILVVPAVEFVFVHRGDTDFGSGVGGSEVWKLAERILTGRTGDPRPDPDLVPLDPESFSRRLPPLEEPEVIEMSVKQLDAYTGTYRLNPEMEITIRRYGDQLAARMTGPQGGEADIFPSAPDMFFGRAVNLRITFRRGPENQVTGLVLEFAGQKMEAEREK